MLEPQWVYAVPNSPKIINNWILKSITHSNDSILELQKNVFKCMQTLSNNLWLYKIYFWKGKKNAQKLFPGFTYKCKSLFWENTKLIYPRYLGDFYYSHTVILEYFNIKE